MTPRDKRLEDLERRVQALEDKLTKSVTRFPTDEERRRLMATAAAKEWGTATKGGEGPR